MTPADAPARPTAYGVRTPDGVMPALLWSGAPRAERPALVVMQEIFGLSAYVRDRCAHLASLGYVVLAPEIYWRLGGDVVSDDDPDLLAKGMALVQQVDWGTAVADGVQAVLAAREVEGVGSVGLVGFCFGGGLAFNVAAECDDEPALLVSYYGSALPQLLDLAPSVTCPSLHHFGTADGYLPMEQVEAIRAAVTAAGSRDDVEVHLYDGAGHAFDNPNPLFHHAAASQESWQHTDAFLARHLPVPTPPRW